VSTTTGVAATTAVAPELQVKAEYLDLYISLSALLVSALVPHIMGSSVVVLGDA